VGVLQRTRGRQRLWLKVLLLVAAVVLIQDSLPQLRLRAGSNPSSACKPARACVTDFFLSMQAHKHRHHRANTGLMCAS
jgi:hypothetical protein